MTQPIKKSPIYNPVSTKAPAALLLNDGDEFKEEHMNETPQQIKQGDGCYGQFVHCCGFNCGACCGDTVACLLDW
jgi:hypothetical protein